MKLEGSALQKKKEKGDNVMKDLREKSKGFGRPLIAEELRKRSIRGKKTTRTSALAKKKRASQGLKNPTDTTASSKEKED